MDEDQDHLDEDQDHQSESKRLFLLLTAISELLREIVARQSGQPGREPVANQTDDDRRRSNLTELQEHGYMTNDWVHVSGGFKAPERHLKINGRPKIHLTKAEFFLFLILAAHGRSLQGLSAPRQIMGGKFLGAEDIIRAVDAWRIVEPRLTSFWTQATFNDVHRAVSELRKKIRLSGGNPNIIETGPKGEWGYRLSTSPFNVTIDLQ